MTTLVLFPADAEPYSYHPIKARIDGEAPNLMRCTDPDQALRIADYIGEHGEYPTWVRWGFLWGVGAVQWVDTTKYRHWVVINIPDGSGFTASNQRDRLASGLYPSYESVQA